MRCSWFNIGMCDIDAILCQFLDLKFYNLARLLPNHIKFSADTNHAPSYTLNKFHQCGLKNVAAVVSDVNAAEKFAVKCIPSGKWPCR